MPARSATVSGNPWHNATRRLRLPVTSGDLSSVPVAITLLQNVRRTPGISCERPIRSALVSFIPLLGGLVIP